MSTFEELKARRERERRLFDVSSGKTDALKGVTREAAYHTAASVGGNFAVAVTPEDRMRQQIPVERSFSPIQTRAPREIFLPETTIVRQSPVRMSTSPGHSRIITGYTSPVRGTRVAGYTSPVRAERSITVASPTRLDDSRCQYRVAVAPGSPGVSSTLVHREVPIQVPVEVPREVPVDRVFKCLERVPVPIKHERKITVPVTKVVKKPVTRIVEIPVERIIEKLVTRRVTRVIEVPVERIVEKPVEKIVEVKVEKIIEVPVDRVIVKKITVPYEVVIEKTVEVPVERVIPRIIEKTIEKIVEVPVERLVEQTVEIALEHMIRHDIEVPVERVVEKIMEVPVEHLIERVREVPVEKIVEKIVEVEVIKVVEKFVESEPIIVQKMIEREVYIENAPQIHRNVEEVVEYVTTTNTQEYDMSGLSAEEQYRLVSEDYGQRRSSLRSMGSMRNSFRKVGDEVSFAATQPVVTETSYQTTYTTDGAGGAYDQYSSGAGGAVAYGSSDAAYGAGYGASYGTSDPAAYYSSETTQVIGGGGSGGAESEYERISSQYSLRQGSFRNQMQQF